mmetsp:Transcript_5997/g.5405  ORF Transcript_5997/g.5405 Transcript_5997/m.5405 type:complete len:142 (+) Transcript_5997:421-846(+)
MEEEEKEPVDYYNEEDYGHENHEASSSDEEGEDGEKKKDKKLVFLSRTVLDKVRSKPMTTGTQIANEILELYKQFSEKVDFKNVQRRVYDALNVLSALNIITKDKSHIIYNKENEHVEKQNGTQKQNEQLAFNIKDLKVQI